MLTSPAPADHAPTGLIPTRSVPAEFADDIQTPAARVRAGVTRLMQWAGKSEMRRELFGTAAADLSPNDMGLLHHINQSGPARASDLAARAGVDKSTMTTQVHRLENKGLVERTPDPVDGRASLLSPSAQGRRLQQEIDTAGALMCDEILAEWPLQDRETLGALLNRFTEELSQRVSASNEPEMENDQP